MGALHGTSGSCRIPQIARRFGLSDGRGGKPAARTMSACAPLLTRSSKVKITLSGNCLGFQRVRMWRRGWDSCRERRAERESRRSLNAARSAKRAKRNLAERVGFEPTCPLRDKTLSRRPRYDHFGTSPQRNQASQNYLFYLISSPTTNRQPPPTLTACCDRPSHYTGSCGWRPLNTARVLKVYQHVAAALRHRMLRPRYCVGSIARVRLCALRKASEGAST